MKVFAFVAIFMVCCVVFVGAFNAVYETDNRPYTVYEILVAFADLNLDFEVSTETLETLKTHFENFNDESYKLQEEYLNASFFEKLFEDWKHNSIIIRLVTFLFDIVAIVVGFVIDLLVLLIELLTFGYRLVRGVPA